MYIFFLMARAQKVYKTVHELWAADRMQENKQGSGKRKTDQNTISEESLKRKINRPPQEIKASAQT
jgi:hypothetical protein